MKLKLRRAAWQEPWLSGILITLASILAYGILIPQLGFYRDDWYMLWAAQAWGIDGIVGLFEGDRPFLGWMYAFDYTLLGYAPLGWHIYGLFLRVLTSLLFLWFLRLIWPKNRTETTFAALILTLYPGYLQQPNAATFNPTHVAYSAAIVSLALNVLTIRTTEKIKKIAYTILSVILVGFYLFIYESLIGIEAFRVIMIGYLFWRDNEPVQWKTIFKNLAKHLWPYLLFSAGFTYWRLFLFESTRRAVNVDVIFGQYGQSPLRNVANLASEFLKDLFEIVVLAWFVPFYQYTVQGNLRDLVFSVGLALLACALVVIYRWWTKPFENLERAPAIDWLWLGAIFVAITTLPIIIAGRHVIFGIQWDRYTYQAIIGVSLLVVGVAYTSLRAHSRFVFLYALLFISVVTHYHSAAFYSEFWEYQKQTWQQLSWRAPDLMEGTNIVAVLPRGYRLAEEYEIWGPANFIYSPGGPLKISGQVLHGNLYYDLHRGVVEQRQMRNVLVNRDYTKTLIISLPAPGSCLYVIDGKRPELSMREDIQVRQVAPYSKIEQILANASPNPAPSLIFGAENQNHWCYYYQKISLARQNADWHEATRLADEAESLGLKPADAVEWLPVYESYANAGREKDAQKTATKIKSDRSLRRAVCFMYQDSEWPLNYNVEFIQSTLCD